MGKMKDLATNLYAVGLVDKDGKYGNLEIFGPSRIFVQMYLRDLGFDVLWIENLEGDGK